MQKKTAIVTPYEAIATLGLLADAICRRTSLDPARLNNLKGAALGTRGAGPFYDYGIREYLQSLFKAITMGIGYNQGVIKPATPLTKDQMDTYRDIVKSVNSYFDATSQKPDEIHFRVSQGLDSAEIQGHVDACHRLMCASYPSTAKDLNPTVFSSTDGDTEVSFMKVLTRGMNLPITMMPQRA